MKIDFSNKVVLITGATRGIGKQLAHDFEMLGADLILTGTSNEQIYSRQKSEKKNTVKNIDYLCVDFSNESTLHTFIHKLSKYKKIDVCINNAGVNKIKYIWETAVPEWENIFNVNLYAPFLIMREVSKTMKRNGYGRIVNIASIFGVISKQKRAIYSSSKSGLIGLTRGVAIDLAPYNILVNSVSPGFVLTDLTKSVLTPSEIKELTVGIPCGRMADPEDISTVVLFLCSQLNTYITGQNIIVDGGYVCI